MNIMKFIFRKEWDATAPNARKVSMVYHLVLVLGFPVSIFLALCMVWIEAGKVSLNIYALLLSAEVGVRLGYFIALCFANYALHLSVIPSSYRSKVNGIVTVRRIGLKPFIFWLAGLLYLLGFIGFTVAITS